MAASFKSGWTAASLLPSLASGFSPGFSVGSKMAPAQVTGNPYALKPSLDQTSSATAFRNSLVNRIVGGQPQQQPQPLSQMIPKAPGTNPSVNNLSDIGFQYPSLLSKL